MNVPKPRNASTNNGQSIPELGSRVRINVDSTDNEQENQSNLVGIIAVTVLVSMVVHFLLLILLALMMSQIPKSQSLEIILQPTQDIPEDIKYAFTVGDPTIPETPVKGDDPEQPAEIPVWTVHDNPEETDLPRSDDLKINDIADVGMFTDDTDINDITLSFENRTGAGQRTAMTRGGGDESTEYAVQLGLKWLSRQQYPNGSWSLRGPYRDGRTGPGDNRIAATGLALLAFQGCGDTCERGQYVNNVKKGWTWLLQQQDEDGCFYKEDSETSEHRFYTHGICTIAICELYAMTREPEIKAMLRESAQQAVDYCIKTQSPTTGGWKYYVDRDKSDVSVTGWIVMALQSARMAGLTVPQKTFDNVSAFLDKIAREGGSRYPYEEGTHPTVSMTAEALLCRQYLGWKRDDPRLVDGVKWLTREENLICFTAKDEAGRSRTRDVYYWYYATQVMHHYRGQPWKTWNDAMKQQMCENQVQTRGDKEEGSWNPFFPSRDKWCEEGRFYVTCLSIYILEVYYRHLPIYRDISVSDNVPEPY